MPGGGIKELIKSIIAGPESQGKMYDKNGKPLPNAYASQGQTAKGKYQITDSTWNSINNQFYAKTKKRLDRNSLQDNEIAMDLLLDNYKNSLKANGVPVNPTTLYAMHFKGDAKWIKAAMKNPNLPTSALFSSEEIKYNPTYLPNKTVGQTLKILNQKVNSSSKKVLQNNPIKNSSNMDDKLKKELGLDKVGSASDKNAWNQWKIYNQQKNIINTKYKGDKNLLAELNNFYADKGWIGLDKNGNPSGPFNTVVIKKLNTDSSQKVNTNLKTYHDILNSSDTGVYRDEKGNIAKIVMSDVNAEKLKKITSLSRYKNLSDLILNRSGSGAGELTGDSLKEFINLVEKDYKNFTGKNINLKTDYKNSEKMLGFDVTNTWLAKTAGGSKKDSDLYHNGKNSINLISGQDSNLVDYIVPDISQNPLLSDNEWNQNMNLDFGDGTSYSHSDIQTPDYNFGNYNAGAPNIRPTVTLGEEKKKLVDQAIKDEARKKNRELTENEIKVITDKALAEQGNQNVNEFNDYVDLMKSINDNSQIQDFSYDPKTQKSDIPFAEAAMSLVGIIKGNEMAKTPIPARDEQVSAGFQNYVGELSKLSQIGLRPEEEAYAKRMLSESYQSGLEQVVHASGGNRNIVLGNLGRLDFQKQMGLINIALEDAKAKNEAMYKYGEAVKYISEFDANRDIANNERKYQDAMMTKQVGGQLAAQGWADLMNNIQYYRDNKPGSANHMLKTYILTKQLGYNPNEKDPNSPNHISQYKKRIDGLIQKKENAERNISMYESLSPEKKKVMADYFQKNGFDVSSDSNKNFLNYVYNNKQEGSYDFKNYDEAHQKGDYSLLFNPKNSEKGITSSGVSVTGNATVDAINNIQNPTIPTDNAKAFSYPDLMNFQTEEEKKRAQYLPQENVENKIPSVMKDSNDILPSNAELNDKSDLAIFNQDNPQKAVAPKNTSNKIYDAESNNLFNEVEKQKKENQALILQGANVLDKNKKVVDEANSFLEEQKKNMNDWQQVLNFSL